MMPDEDNNFVGSIVMTSRATQEYRLLKYITLIVLSYYKSHEATYMFSLFVIEKLRIHTKKHRSLPYKNLKYRHQDTQKE